MAERRRALGHVGVGADDRRKFVRQRRDALHALALRAELFVKHDLVELRQTVFELRLQIGLVEELRVRQPRGDDALIAGDDRLAVVARLDIGDEDEAIGESAPSWRRSTKHF